MRALRQEEREGALRAEPSREEALLVSCAGPGRALCLVAPIGRPALRGAARSLPRLHICSHAEGARPWWGKAWRVGEQPSRL